MNADVAPHLALLLFLPWYAVLGWLFWRMRGSGGSAVRRLTVLAIIGASLLSAGIAGVWAYHHADASVGAIWKQVLACAVGYAAFLVGLVAGIVVLPRSSGPTGTAGQGRPV